MDLYTTILAFVFFFDADYLKKNVTSCLPGTLDKNIGLK